jgi:hypothetical protein
MDTLLYAVPVGVGATAAIDAWAWIRQRWLGIKPLDYGLVGRWIAYLPKGRLVHSPIAASAPVKGERWIGWISHYAIGIAFAGVLLALWGSDWVSRPSLGPALAVGIASVAAPFLVMQPGMGMGVAARRAARPNAARIQALITHAIFGLGLYAAGIATASFIDLTR